MVWCLKVFLAQETAWLEEPFTEAGFFSGGFSGDLSPGWMVFLENFLGFIPDEVMSFLGSSMSLAVLKRVNAIFLVLIPKKKGC